MAPSGHRTDVDSQEIGSPADLFDSWLRFVGLLADGAARSVIGTAEAVEALIARSALQRVIETGAAVDAALLSQTDEAYRRHADELLEATRVALYGAKQPVTDWWWRVGELNGKADDNFVDVADAARLKRVHPHTVRAAIHDAILPARRLGRTFLVHRRDLERWQPRSVGRPAHGERRDDELVAAFNSANTRRDFERAHAIAELIAARPTTGRRCLALALDAFNRGQYDDALNWATKAQDLGLDARGRATAAIAASSALVSMNRPREAVAQTAGIEAPPDLELALAATRIDARIAQHDVVAARAEVERALRQLPDDTQPHFLAARVEFHGGDLVRAIEHISVFRARFGQVPEGLMLHGSILGKLGDALGDAGLYRQALHLFWRARHDEGHRALAKIGLSAARLGRWRLALRAVRSIAANGDSEGVFEIESAALRSAEAADDPHAVIRALDLADDWLGPTVLSKLYRVGVLGAAGEWLSATALLGSVRDSPDQPTELRLRHVAALLSIGRLADAVALADQLPLAQTPLKLLPDLLRLRLLLENQSENEEEVEENYRATVDLLRHLSDEPGTTGLLSNMWLAATESSRRRETRLVSALRTVSAPPGIDVIEQPWDVFHRKVSPVEPPAIVAASRA